MGRTGPLANTCSVCGFYSFRKCDCPWSLPFSEWKGEALAKLRKVIPGAGG